MSYPALRRFTLCAASVVVAAVVGDRLLAFGAVRHALGGAVPAVAAAISLVPMTVAIVYLALQVVPGGRRAVIVPGTREGDAWLLLLVFCQFTPTMRLTALVPAGMWGSTYDQGLIALAAVALAVVVRVLQLRQAGTVQRGILA